jgi:hypothetical protein
MNWKPMIAAAALAAALVPAAAQAQSISAVEGARAKDRQGAYLSREDRDNLRRYGSNDDYGYGGYGYGYSTYGYGAPVYGGAYYDDDYGYGYGYGPSVGIYIGD